MKKILFFIVLSYFGNLYCQKDDSFKAKEEFENFIFNADSIKIQNIKSEKFQSISEIFKYNQFVTRELDFDLKESIFKITYSYLFNNSFRYPDAEIHLFYYKNKIIDRLIIYESEKIQISNRYDSEIEYYIQNHNSFYNTKTTVKDFLTDILKKEIFGDGCGYEMTRLKKIDEIELNNPENAEKYVEWMKSYNPEKQMWGYFEISKLLKKELVELDSSESKIYNHIKERNAVIETCSGCIFGIFEKVFKINFQNPEL